MLILVQVPQCGKELEQRQNKKSITVVDLVSDSVSCTKGKDDHSMRQRLLVARKASAVAVHLQPGRLGSARGSPGTLGVGA